MSDFTAFAMIEHLATSLAFFSGVIAIGILDQLRIRRELVEGADPERGFAASCGRLKRRMTWTGNYETLSVSSGFRRSLTREMG